ncbi:MAG: hypothetical protein LBG74_07325, partial [Spirochaetaceae bacterium]|nr:hypothetical protein [Spirochaetaceae bacterium]
YGIQNDTVQFWYYLTLLLKESNPRLLAYLIYMTARLLEMHRILKPSGSLYLHCDPTASHYLKIVMDNIFGREYFRNEIIWHYTGNSVPKSCYPRKHDVIFFYSKQKEFCFYPQNALVPYSELTEKRYNHTDTDGRRYKVSALRNGKQEIVYMKEGKYPDDVWDIPVLRGKERLGYPTQKPLALLERIIKASSKEGDVVFDPFCGCGTTIEAAIKNQRNWIGCDIAIHSIKLIQETRIQKYGLQENKEYQIEGVPQSTEQAQYLFESDPFQFQYWAVEKTGGFCSNKKTADRGIDGRIYFEAHGELRSMVLSVKGGAVKPADIRDLRGVLEREGAEMAGFICLREPTKEMLHEADAAGVYEYKGVNYPRVQVLSVRDIFDGKMWHCPSVVKQIRKDKGEMYLAL